MLEIKPIPLNEWDRFVETRPEALLFHTSTWLNLLKRVYGLEWEGLGAWVGGELVGVFPLMKRRLGPFHLGGSPLMMTIASTPFMGPLSDPIWQIPIVKAIQPLLHSKHIDHIEIAFPGLIEDWQRLESLGYTLEVCQTIVLELEGRTQDQLWYGLDGSCRRAVRKSEAQGVRIVECHDASFIEEYYKMCQEVYLKTGRTPHLSKMFYTQIWETFSGTGIVKAFLALLGDRTLAGGIFLAFRDTVYYLSGASFDRAQSLRPNNSIQWYCMEWAAVHHFRHYDLGGAVVPGITRFKLSFGGQRVSYMRIYRANSWISHSARRVYQITIPIWRKVLSLYPTQDY